MPASGSGLPTLLSLLQHSDGTVLVQDVASVVATLNKDNEFLDEAAVMEYFGGAMQVGGGEFTTTMEPHEELVTLSKLAKYEAAFRLFDNGNNTILPLDAKALIRILGGTANPGATRNSTLNARDDFDPMSFSDFILFTSLSDHRHNMQSVVELIQILKLVDSDASGLISLDEAHVLLHCLGCTESKPEISEMMEKLENNNNNKPPEVSYSGFVRVLAAVSGGCNLQTLLDTFTVFKLFDQSGDGVVTVKELANVFRALGKKPTPEYLNSMMQTIDTNSDGVIVFSEFLSLIAGQIDTSMEEQKVKQRLYQASLCGECQATPATLDCTECHESYCKECCTSVHSRGRRKHHCAFVNIKVCGECGIIAATTECSECTEFFCDACSAAVHERGRRKLHTQLRELDSRKFRAIEYDASNGFGLHVIHDLSIARFGRENAMQLTAEDFPPYMREAFTYMEDTVQICQEHNALFIDTVYTQQEISEVREVPSISLGIDGAERHNFEQKNLRRRELDKLDQVEGHAPKLFTWARPSQVYKTPFLFTSGNPILGDWPVCLPRPTTLIPNLVKYIPGSYNDAWLVLCISMIAVNKDLFSNLIVGTDFVSHGIYSFQFFNVERNAWEVVVIDSYVPLMLDTDQKQAPKGGTSTTTAELLPEFGRVEEAGSLWLIYIMKSYAKFRGSYSYLHSGCVPRALVELSGGEVLSERWNSKRINTETTAIVWWKLNIATRLNLLVACFNIPNSVEHSQLDEIDVEEDNIAWGCGEHVVLTVDVTPMMTADITGSRKVGGLKFIKLRNLYGKSSVEGSWDWGPESTKWSHKRVRNTLNHKRVNECLQWVDVRDFVLHYNTLVTLVNTPGSSHTFFSCLEPCSSGKTACNAQQYLLCLSRPGEDGDNLAAALPSQDDVDEELYDAPDFREADESSDEDFCDQNTFDHSDPQKSRYAASKVKTGYPHPGGANQAEKKGFLIKLFLSQPSLGCLSDGPVKNSNLSVKVFRLLGKGVQAAEQVQGDDDVVEDAYKWPTYNMMQTEILPVNEPSANQEKLRELNALETLQSFTVAQPGFYAVVVEQAHHGDTANYCIALSGKEISPIETTGLSLSCEPVGSFFDPKYRLDKFSDRGSQSCSSLGRATSRATIVLH